MVGSSAVTANGQRRDVAPSGMVIVNCGVCSGCGGKSPTVSEFRFQRHADWALKVAGYSQCYTDEKCRANISPVKIGEPDCDGTIRSRRGFAHGGELNAEHAKEKQLPNRSYRTLN
jgi:hypothetical protein